MSSAVDRGARGVVPGGRDELPVERHFEVRKQTMLDFFNGQEQCDVLIDPGQGKLMFNGRDIYWPIGNEQRMSDTINNAVAIWLSDDSIEEVLAPSGVSTAARSDEPTGRKMRSRQPPSMMTRLKRHPDGSQQVVLPEGTVPRRLGQRVWFQAGLGRIEVSPKPQGRRGDR